MCEHVHVKLIFFKWINYLLVEHELESCMRVAVSIIEVERNEAVESIGIEMQQTEVILTCTFY